MCIIKVEYFFDILNHSVVNMQFYYVIWCK